MAKRRWIAKLFVVSERFLSLFGMGPSESGLALKSSLRRFAGLGGLDAHFRGSGVGCGAFSRGFQWVSRLSFWGPGCLFSAG